MESVQASLIDMAEDAWFGSAIDVYSRQELIQAGLRAPLTGAVRESRDHPARFYGPEESHAYVRFTAHADVDRMRQMHSIGPCVALVAMGSYAPAHEGHVSMMEAADDAIRAEGDTPIAAVFSLHSAEHVRAKILPTRPDAPIATETRLMEARQVVGDRLASGTPAFIDTWDATMPGGPRSFTDVMRRLANTLASFEFRNVTPIAVFGSDNAVSMRAFARYGRCICVERPGHESISEEIFTEPQMRDAIRERRVLTTARKTGGGEISSTAIRAGRR